jgi:hypothetical protein
LFATGTEIAFAKAVLVKPFVPALASTLTISSWLHAIGRLPKREHSLTRIPPEWNATG